MKINPHIRYIARYVSFRFNVIVFIIFALCMVSCYASLIEKRKTYPNIPWYAMFFKVSVQPSWKYAAPFNK
jgi:hypothetical protein